MSTVFWITLLAGGVALFVVTRGGGNSADLPEFRERGAPVVDVRSPAEFAAGHVHDALNIPLDQLSVRMAELEKGPVVVYCASGMRSRRARALLEGSGFEVLDMSRLGNFPADQRR